MVKKKNKTKKNSLPKGLKMSKKEVRDYQKMISKKNHQDQQYHQLYCY